MQIIVILAQGQLRNDALMSTPSQSAIEKAAKIIRAGRLVAIPTETVYGLAADATNNEAVARIFEAKERPRFNPLIAHVSGRDMAAQFVEFPPLATKLASAFWPGPLTLVLPRRKQSALSLLASAGLETQAVRAPDHETAQALIRAVGKPLAAPSANRSGAISPTKASHVRQSLGDRVDMVLDGGDCSVGVESTIVKVDGDVVYLLRPGGLAREEIERVVGASLKTLKATSKPQAPGALSSHYAPDAPLRLNVKAPTSREVWLAFGPAPSSSDFVLNLSPRGDLREAAANLFSAMREADDLCKDNKLKGIAAAPIPSGGLGEAINDRLKRAAAPRKPT